LRKIALILGISLFLAGEIVTYVDENGRLVITNIPSRKPKKRWKRLVEVSSSPYRELISRISRRHGVDPKLVRALITVESGFNPRAVSKKGAMGLMQLMPETARKYGAEDPFDPAQNIEAGIRYLKELLRRFRRTELALAAYNAGEKAVVRYGGIPPFPETRRFVKNVMKLYRRRRKTPIYRCLGKNGSVIVSNSPPLPQDCAGPIERIK